MRSRRIGLVFIIVGLVLTGCQANAVSTMQTRAAQHLPPALAQIVNPPPPEVRCLRSLSGAQPRLVAGLADAAAGLDEAIFQSGDWGNLSDEVARDARVSHPQPRFEIISGSDDAALLVGTWCGYHVEPIHLYVVDYEGNASLVGVVDDYLDVLTYDWFDGIWGIAVSKQFGEIDKPYSVLVGLIVPDESDWHMLFVPDIEAYRLQGFDLPYAAPEFMNADGMDQLLVNLEQPDGSAVQRIYLWGIGVYAHVEDRQDGS